MTRFLALVFLFTALLPNINASAQTASHAPVPALTKWRLSEQSQSSGRSTNLSYPSSHRALPPGTQAVNTIFLGSSPNIYGVAFGPKTNLFADPNTNTLMMVFRSNLDADGSLRYSFSNNGGGSFTPNAGPLYVPNTLLGRSRARFPQGSIYNPTGNTSAANTQANFFAPSLANLVPSGWGGLVHGARPLASGTAVATQENRSSFLIPDGGALNPFDNSFWISSGLYDSSGVYKDSILLGKGVWTSNQYQYTYTNLYFPVQQAPDGSKRFEATNIAWGYNGTGYLALICHESYNAVQAYNYYPVIFKTTDNGATWNKIASIDMYSFSGFYQTSAAYSTGFDLDLAVDANNNLHLFTAILPVGASPFTVSDTPGQWGMFDIHTTDGGTTWSSFRVASPQAFRGEWSDTQVLFEDNRPQLSKTWNGNRLFYVWFDSDTAGTGARFNNYPNAMVAGLNITTGNTAPARNTTDTSLLVADACIFGNVSPYTLLNSSTGCHKIPISIVELAIGTINSKVDYLYLTDIELCNSAFGTPPVLIPVTNLSFWAGTVAGASTGCQSTTSTYSISSLAGATQYVWTMPPGTTILSGQGDTTITVQYGATSGIITVQAFDNGVLIGTSNAPLTTLPINIGVSATTTSICRGGTGTTLTASGGITYSWSPTTGLSSSTGSSVTATPSSSTLYTVTGTASNGCNVSKSIAITVLDAPTVSIGALDTTAFCLGDSVVIVARSTDATTYQWSRNGTNILNATDTLFVAKQTGNYRVTVTNINGCTARSAPVSVTVFIPAQISFTASPSAQICDSGVVSLSGTGGVSYLWSDNITDGIPFSIQVTDTFTVIGTDSNGCLDTATAIITVNPKPMVDASTAVTICRGSSTTLRATGALSYSWTPTNGLGGISTGDSVVAAPITTTLYTVTGSNGSGCSSTDTVTVFVNPRPTVTVSGNDTICPGASTTLSASGASTFTWSPLAGLSTGTGSTVTASPDSTRTYTVTGTAGNGCTNAASISVIVRQRPDIGFIASPGLEICSGDSITLSGTGGISYVWSGNITNGSAFSLSTWATFTVTGTDANGCTDTANATVLTRSLPAVDASSAVTLCLGEVAALSASGAIDYSWSPTNGLGGNATGDSVSASPVATTLYSVTGTDSLGCSSSDTVTVTVLPLPSISISGNDTICPGSSSVLTATGASSYSWSPPNGLSSLNTSNVTANPDSTILYTVVGTSNSGCTNSAIFLLEVFARPQIGISAFPAFEFCGPDTITLNGTGGTNYTWTGGISNGIPFYLDTTTAFTVTGTDLNGCTGTATIFAGVNDLPLLTVSGPSSLCIGDTIILSVSGGSSYDWHPSTGLSSDTGRVVKAFPTSGITYTITGNNGCIDSTTFTLAVNSLPQVSAGTDVQVCQGGNVLLNATGATIYSWAPSAGLNATTGANVIASPASTTDYIVTGTDGNGCLNRDTVTVSVLSLPSIGFAVSPSNQLCGSGTVTLSGTGGVSYAWTGGATDGQPVQVNSTTTFTVTGTDSNGCTNTANALIAVNSLPNVVINGTKTICINDSTTLTAVGASSYTWSPSTGLSTTTGSVVRASPPATTTYTVIGNNGCVDTTLVTVTVRSRPNLVISGSGTLCEGKSTVLTATGGAAFQWSPSTGLNRTDSATVTASPSGTTTYTVVSTGSNGCTSSSDFTLTVNAVPVVSAAGDTTVCSGRIAPLSASGAINYQWSPAAGLNVANQASVIATPISTTAYNVIGTDNNGCTGTDTVLIQVNALPAVNLGTDKSVCTGSSTSLTATGALTYQWTPATGLSATTGPVVTASPLSTTMYIVTGTDGNGCSRTDTIKVNVNPLPNVTTGPGTSICQGSNITLTASGADSAYAWSPAIGLNSVTGSSVIASPASTTAYTVTGTNATGCTNSSTITLTVNPLPAVSAGADRFICLGDTATLTATGASTYGWSPSTGLSSSAGSTVTAFPASSRTYVVTGTDGNGCTNRDTVVVHVLPLPTVNAGPDKAFCTGGSTTLTATGAQNYQWSPAIGLSSTISPTVIASPGSTTTYFVIGTDGNGCTRRDTLTVTVNPLPGVIAGPGSSICPGGSVALSASGADSSYAWSPATGLSATFGNNVTASPPATTTYTVTGTNVTGCTNTFSFTVTVKALPNVSAGNDKTICQGDTVSLNASGGVSFTWSPTTALSAGSGPTVLAFPTVSSAYVVTGTGVNGCTAKDTVQVTVWSLPSVQAGPDVSICRGDTVTLNASGATTYTWSPALGLSSTTGPTVWAFPNSTRSYIVTGRDSNNCRNKDTITVQVFTLPPVNTGNDVSICLGDSATLTSSGAASYAWSPPTGLNSTSGNTVTASPSGTTTYFVTGTDINGCVDTSQITVTVNLPPNITATVIPNDTLCANSPVTLDAQGAAFYQWSGGVQNGVPFITGSGGVFIVTGTDTNGCSSLDSIRIISLPAPSPLTITGDTVVITGSSYPYSLNDSTMHSLQWIAQGGTILSGQGTDSITVQWDSSGTCILTLVQTSANGCSDTATLVITSNPGTGFADSAGDSGLLLYPNPASGVLWMDFTTEKQRLIRLTDMRGRSIDELRISGKRVQLDFSHDLQSGVYIIQVMDGNRTEFVRKLMIEGPGK